MIQEKARKQKIRKGAYRYTNIDMMLSINARPRRKASARARFDSEKLNCYLLTRNSGRQSGKEAEAVDEERAREHHKTASIEELAEKMPKEESFGQVASVFQQISDCTRLRILWLLCHTTASVGAMRADGLVSAKRSGKEVYYTLAASDKARLLHRTIDAMFEIACPSEDD